MAERSRILVVDDETQITRVLKTTLQSQGYEVRTAAEGESALNLAVDWIPDIIVTDLSMPGMTARLPAKIAPGDSGAIVVEWATDRVQGSVRGVAVIETNDPHRPSITLALVGAVRRSRT